MVNIGMMAGVGQPLNAWEGLLKWGAGFVAVPGDGAYRGTMPDTLLPSTKAEPEVEYAASRPPHPHPRHA